MTTQEIIWLIGGILIAIFLVIVEIDIRAYSRGFKDGLKWSLYNSVFTKDKAEKERGET